MAQHPQTKQGNRLRDLDISINTPMSTDIEAWMIIILGCRIRSLCDLGGILQVVKMEIEVSRLSGWLEFVLTVLHWKLYAER